MKKIDITIGVLTAISCAVFWVLYSAGTQTLFPGAMYWVILIGGFGGLLLRNREKIQQRLRAWRAPALLKFVLLGYGAVLLEEILAAFTNNLTEGFSLPLYLVRVGQFWAFNVLAFTGFIWGWYWLATRIRYSRRELFYLAGIWGLYAEHIYAYLFTNPIGLAVLALPTILAYGVIITPAMLSVEKTGARTLNTPLKYIVTFLVIFVCSIIPTLVLLHLRASFPGAFPPTNFIP
jgi:hypothetical protein